MLIALLCTSCTYVCHFLQVQFILDQYCEFLKHFPSFLWPSWTSFCGFGTEERLAEAHCECPEEAMLEEAHTLNVIELLNLFINRDQPISTGSTPNWFSEETKPHCNRVWPSCGSKKSCVCWVYNFSLKYIMSKRLKWISSHYNMNRCKKNISFNMFCIFYISKCEASQRWSMSCVAPSPWLVACAPFVSSAGQPRQRHLPRRPGRSSGDPPRRDDLTRQITQKI